MSYCKPRGFGGGGVGGWVGRETYPQAFDIGPEIFLPPFSLLDAAGAEVAVGVRGVGVNALGRWVGGWVGGWVVGRGERGGSNEVLNAWIGWVGGWVNGSRFDFFSTQTAARSNALVLLYLPITHPPTHPPTHLPPIIQQRVRTASSSSTFLAPRGERITQPPTHPPTQNRYVSGHPTRCFQKGSVSSRSKNQVVSF